MGRLSRNKGRSFEQSIATLFREAFPWADVRRSQQGDGAHTSDVVIRTPSGDMVLDDLWIECCHARGVDPKAKYWQAHRDVSRSSMTPMAIVVIWREHGSRSINATMTAHDLELLGIIARGHLGPAFITMTADAFIGALRSACPAPKEEAA